MPSRLLSRGVRQDANESRNKDLDGEGMTQIQRVFSLHRNEGVVGLFLQASRKVSCQNRTVRWLFEVAVRRFEGVDMNS